MSVPSKQSASGTFRLLPSCSRGRALGRGFRADAEGPRQKLHSCSKPMSHIGFGLDVGSELAAAACVRSGPMRSSTRRVCRQSLRAALTGCIPACFVFVLKNYSGSQMINIGVGKDISIAEFVDMVADIVDYRGKITFDPSKPDGTPRKLVDVSRLSSLGWTAKVPLREGLRRAYAAFLES